MTHGRSARRATSGAHRARTSAADGRTQGEPPPDRSDDHEGQDARAAPGVLPDPPDTGHEAVLRQLYADHGGPLLAFVLRLTAGDRQRAEDVVQETLLRAWRNVDRLGASQGRSPRPWLVTVARRIVIDEHRGQQARPQEALGHDLDLVSEVDHADRVLQVLTLTEAMRSLNPAQREILVETYVEGHTVAEAARRLGIPLGTAKSRVFYALAALRAAMTERGVTS